MRCLRRDTFGSLPLTARRAYAQAQGDVVTEEPWGRIEKLDEHLWAVVSDFTKGDRTTLCNGGIIAGDNGVLAVETFMTPAGAKWLAEWAERLTGTWPTDVVVTHYHGDHSSGDAGYQRQGKESPRLWVTARTRELIVQSRQRADNDAELDNVKTLDADQDTSIELGGRAVRIRPRSGHTESDVSIHVSDPQVIWAGDLFFNRMVPNYRDSFPRRLTDEVKKLADQKATCVPGHGPVAKQEAMDTYLEFLDVIESAARTAFDNGKTADEAASEFQLPKPFEDWYIFAPTVMPAAFAAWYREFEQDE